MGRKIISTMLIVMIISSLGVMSFANENTLSLADAVNMAIENTDAINDLEDQMEDMWENHNDALTYKNQIEAMLTNLRRFEDLYDKKYVEKETLTPAETVKFTIYQAMFGKTPPKYSGQEMLDTYIKNRDFPHYLTWVGYETMRNNKKQIPITLEVNVKELYVNILNLNDMINSQNLYTSILEDKYESAKLKYELGQISAFSLLNEETNYKIQKLNYEKLDRQLKTLKLNFNNLVGIDLKSDVELTSKLYDFRKIELNDLSFYEESAVENRMEVINAKLTYDMESREAGIIADYLSNPLTNDRLTYDSDLIDAENALDEAILDVKEDVTKAYFETLQSLDDYNSKIDGYLMKTRDLNEKRSMYEKGMLDKNTFGMIEFAYNMAKDSLVSSRRTLNLNYEKLENASSFGPGFESNVGGY
ncbi:TolC family protein [Clostridiaceae bacterium HSG29]|nr:TolC family protein [Clostridiaceae bacterium HSG29]